MYGSALDVHDTSMYRTSIGESVPVVNGLASNARERRDEMLLHGVVAEPAAHVERYARGTHRHAGRSGIDGLKLATQQQCLPAEQTPR